MGSLYDKDKTSNVPGFIYFGFAILIIVIVVGSFLYLKSGARELDKITWCPKSGPDGRYILLIDVTDPVTDVGQNALNRLLEHFWDQSLSSDAMKERGIAASPFLPPYYELVVYLITADSSYSEPIVRVCNPGLKAEVSNWDQLISSPKVIKRRIAVIRGQIEGAIARAPLRGSEPSSPILESLKLIVSKEGADGFEQRNGKAPLKLFMLSDYVQHSKTLTHFKELPSWTTLQARPGFPLIDADLSGSRFYIYYIRRPEYANVQNVVHLSWWEDAIREMGGRVAYEKKL